MFGKVSASPVVRVAELGRQATDEFAQATAKLESLRSVISERGWHTTKEHGPSLSDGPGVEASNLVEHNACI